MKKVFYLLMIAVVFFSLVAATFVKRGSRLVTKPAIASGQVTVTTAGTAVAVSVDSETILIKALAGNSGYIYVGTSAVDSSNGLELSAGEAVEISGFAASGTIYVDSSSNGDKIAYLALN